MSLLSYVIFWVSLNSPELLIRDLRCFLEGGSAGGTQSLDLVCGLIG